MNSLSFHLQRYLDRCVALGATAHSLSSVQSDVRQFVGWLEQTVQVTMPGQISPEHLDRWLLSVRAMRSSKGLPLAPRSIINKTDRVRGFFRQLVREHVLGEWAREVFRDMRRPSLLPRPTPAHAQVQAFLRMMPTDTPRENMLRTIAELLYTSGIRPCELLALDTTDVDLERGLAKVMGKGRRERMVPIGKTALRWLETYIYGIRPSLLRDPTERALWLNQRGRRLSYVLLRGDLHRSLSDGPTRRLTCYTFRRACATEMIRSGASVWVVKELLGHDDLEKLKHYVQLNLLDLQKTHARCHPRDRMPDAEA